MQEERGFNLQTIPRPRDLSFGDEAGRRIWEPKNHNSSRTDALGISTFLSTIHNRVCGGRRRTDHHYGLRLSVRRISLGHLLHRGAYPAHLPRGIKVEVVFVRVSTFFLSFTSPPPPISTPSLSSPLSFCLPSVRFYFHPTPPP